MLRIFRGVPFVTTISSTWVPSRRRALPLLCVRTSSSTALAEDLKVFPDGSPVDEPINPSARLAQKMGIHIEKAKMCTPCPYPTTYVPHVQKLSREQYAKLVLHFQAQLKDVWKKVWFGLYQVQDTRGPTHASQLRKLYMGAGMADLMHKDGSDRKVFFNNKEEKIGLQDLSTALSEDCECPVIGVLMLYDGIALDNMQYAITLLREYEQQIEPLARLYQFLRQNQVDTSLGLPTQDHQAFILHEFRRLADPVTRALYNLDAQMLVLQMDMENEARDIHGGLDKVNTLLVKEEVLDR